MLAATSYVPKKSSRNGALVFSVAGYSWPCCRGACLRPSSEGRISLVGILAASVAALALFVAARRFGLGKGGRAAAWQAELCGRTRFHATIPILEHGTIRVDQRIIATPFRAERTLTADLVPVNIDAVLFWVVWDAEKACVEVGGLLFAAISYLAQTSLREAVGRSTVAEVALRRDQLDEEIKVDIEKEASGWGVDIISVKVRDIVIPAELQNVMSLEAQADRERNARMTVASAEADLAEMLSEAARIYGDEDAALKLRTMLMQYETVKGSGSAVVTVPTAVSDGFAEGVQREGRGL
ncbi:MAG: slipin family protein [Adlercreutzia equolifaciens]